MVIRSTFYDTAPGEGVKETSWAQSAPSRGSLYGVVGAGDLNLTAHPTVPYAVNLSPGQFWAHGVWNESTGPEMVQCVPPANKAVRWDMIASHSDWQPTGGGPTSFQAIQGSPAKALPTEMETRPGIVVDQPLWLVKWLGGESRPQEVIDLRCRAAAGGVEVVDKLALSYLGAPGAEVKLGRSVWRHEAKANGVWGWTEYAAPDLTRWGAPTASTNSEGYGSVAFSPPFPNAGFMAVPVNMPPRGADQGMVTYRLEGVSKTGFNFKAFASTGEPIRNTPLVVAYVALGS